VYIIQLNLSQENSKKEQAIKQNQEKVGREGKREEAIKYLGVHVSTYLYTHIYVLSTSGGSDTYFQEK
jgi:hypothetical protein